MLDGRRFRSMMVFLAAAATAAAPARALGQKASLDSGLPPLLDRDREIALARSAAPVEVSANATILVLERGGYVVAIEGSNGVHCLVGRSRVISMEPHCYDREGSETVLQMQLRRAALKESGKTPDEIDAIVATEMEDGTLRLPRRPAMSYMMSSAQELYNDQGRAVGAWKPHLMIYYPYLSAADLGLGEPNSMKAAAVSPDGGALSSIVVIVPEFVDPVFESGGG